VVAGLVGHASRRLIVPSLSLPKSSTPHARRCSSASPDATTRGHQAIKNRGQLPLKITAFSEPIPGADFRKCFFSEVIGRAGYR
jgi:hypothetical protein